MNDIGNKTIFSKNLKYYLEQTGKDRKEICNDLGLKYSTFCEWISGKKYPRIDKIELLANYFKILKSDLIEDKSVNIAEKKSNTTEHPVLQKYNNLNTIGQCKVDAYIDGLLENTVYLKSDSSTEYTYSFNVAAFGGASKTGELTKETVNQLVNELENIND